MSMKVIRRPDELAQTVSAWKRRGFSVGFVPTMGALHEGHRSLVQRARRECDRVVVSIFVNPLQFGPAEDFNRYPRPFYHDRRVCESSWVDVLFRPGVDDMYPEGFATSVEVGGLSQVLCGEFRPGHFKGVATVVLKLFEQVRPDKAYFGEKDFQQLTILRRMAVDLSLPVAIVACATVREKDGLALSSRNAYLSPQERAVAPVLQRALRLGAELAAKPRAKLEDVVKRMRREAQKASVTVDYLRIVDPLTLQDPLRLRGELRAIGAIRVGRTRLIDNIPVFCKDS